MGDAYVIPMWQLFIASDSAATYLSKPQKISAVALVGKYAVAERAPKQKLMWKMGRRLRIMGAICAYMLRSSQKSLC